MVLRLADRAQVYTKFLAEKWRRQGGWISGIVML
jgi:hypothetical protein